MSREYTEKQIRAALKKAQGNPARAQQHVIAQAMQDPKLLLGLTQGHLTGIVSLWINRVITKMNREPEVVPDEPELLDMTPASFGKEILSAMEKGDVAKFGEESSAPMPGRKKASRNHIDAIHKLAQKGNANLNKDKE